MSSQHPSPGSTPATALQPGVRLGAYEILDLAGAGGMGEVYRARDTRLGRIVAIKVLRGHLALVPEVRERFEREARAISSLNHPHIAALYDIGRTDGMDYLVMEHLEGETLADRLARGAMPTADLLRTGIQIADALDRAHRQGLIHRDLKPGNVMLTKTGAKLLDFGLARTVGVAGSTTDLSSPTMSRSITAEGTIVGTFQYMAPEVLEGKEADTRSDIFSFGAMLYEMATGRRAFGGKSQASLIAAIMKETPAPVSTFDALTPPALDRTVQRCLEKDPDDRYQTARDVLLDLRWILEAGSRAGVAAPVAARRRARERTAWGIAAVSAAAAIAVAAFTLLGPVPEPDPIQFFIHPASEMFVIGAPKISPDGRHLAYNATDSIGARRIWIRPLGSLQARALPGTEGAMRPFWSPDSRYLGFMAHGRLKRVAVTGGPGQTICATGLDGDGSWGRRGVILFDGSPLDSIRGVSATGGDPFPATRIDRARGEVGTAWPQFLPDGRHFLYLALSSHPNETTLYVGDLESDKKVEVARGITSRIEYADPGYLLFVRDRALLAQRFDVKRFRLSGEPIPVVEDVAVGGGGLSNADFSASRNGVLAYRGGQGTLTRLQWVDRSGAVVGALGEADSYSTLSLSPDGRRVVLDYDTNDDIWVMEVSRRTKTRFTFDGATDFWPVWSPDGRNVAFGSDRDGKGSIYLKPASGSPRESLLFQGDQETFPRDWSRDGRYMACVERPSGSGWNVVAIPLTPGLPTIPIAVTPFNEVEPRFSPDSRWVAYSSNESGRWEVYVTPFPDPGERWQVSNDGGQDPSWRPDGKELYFLGPTGTMMVVDVEAAPSLRLGTPRALFSGVALAPGPYGHRYAVTPDGRRFLICVVDRSKGLPETTVFVNWTTRL